MLPRAALAVSLAVFLTAEPALATPEPKLGKSALVSEVSGTVTFAEKGETRLQEMSKSPTLVPIGSSIDARRGKVRVRTAGRRRGLDQAMFWKGAFTIRQDRRDAVPEMFVLGETCADAPRLWAESSDAFRTVGRFSGVQAIEDDTRWRTEDLCDGTRHFAKSGRLRAYDGPVVENPIEAGGTIQHYCDYDGVEPVSSWFCTMLDNYPDLDLYGPGIATLGTATSYDVCVTNPMGVETCESYPLSEPFTSEGHRFSVLGCTADSGPGAYSVRWLVDGVQLGPAMPFRSDRPPGQGCIQRT